MASSKKTAGGRYVTSPPASSLETTDPHPTPVDLEWEAFRGVGDPSQKYSIWRICEGERQLVATCATPEAVGVALITLGLEHEFDDCPVGILIDGHPRGTWALKPWLASPKNASDAGRVLRQRRDIQSHQERRPS